MSNHLFPNFRIADEPNAHSVSVLAHGLRDDFVGGSVSSKMYAHRSRVVRQQTAKLRLLASEVRALPTLAQKCTSHAGSVDRWENEGGPIVTHPHHLDQE